MGKQVKSAKQAKERLPQVYKAPEKLLNEVSKINKKLAEDEQRGNTFLGKLEKAGKQAWQRLTGTEADPNFTELIKENGSYAFAMARRREFLVYDEAKAFIQELKAAGIIIESQRKYQEFWRIINNLEKNTSFRFNEETTNLTDEQFEKVKLLPFDPNQTYKEDWSGAGNFFGTGRVAAQDK